MADYTLNIDSVIDAYWVNLIHSGGSPVDSWPSVAFSDVLAILTSGDDSAFVQFFGGYNRLWMSLTDIPALAAGERIVVVQPWARWGEAVGGNTDTYLTLQPGTDNSFRSSDHMTAWNTGIASYFGSERTVAPDGGPWTEAKVNAMTYQIEDLAAGSTKPEIRRMWVTVKTNFKPSVAVSGPSGTITTTTRPHVIGTYSDAEGDPLQKYKIRVFSAAQYGVGGFDPNFSPSTWDSGEIFTSPVNAQIAVHLANGTYRAYVWVADRWGYGDPAFSGFTINVTAPPTPTITATPDNANARTVLTITNATANMWATIQADYGDGKGFVTVRGMNTIPIPVGTLTLYDYDIPPWGAIYRITGIQYANTDDPIASAISGNQTVTPAFGGWWAKSSSNPSLNIRLKVDTFTFKRRIPGGTYDPLGRKDSVSMNDGVKGMQANLALWVKDQTNYDAINALIDLNEPILLVDGQLHRQWWVKFDSEIGFEQIRSAAPVGSGLGLRHFHKATFQVNEVRKPTA